MRPVTTALTLIPADAARRILRDVTPVGTELVALEAAVGRVLALPLIAGENVPRDTLSAMDGYAVRAADVVGASSDRPVRLRLRGAILAGTTFTGVVGPGETVAIVTGGVVPDGADAVVMVESTQPDADAPGDEGAAGVRVLKTVALGANLVLAGEDLMVGSEVLPAGRRLRASDIAALATFGVVQVAVHRRPRIAVFATGSELCPPDQLPRRGQVRDSNSYVLAAQVELAGCTAVRADIVDDDVDRLRAAVRWLCVENDGVILSGGSSIGPKDLTGEVLRGLDAPGVLFHGIDIRPGKPTVFARSGSKPVVGMPGYPTSSMIVFEAFIRPMLQRLGGEHVAEDFAAAVRAYLAKPYLKPATREDYLRVRLSPRADATEGADAAGWWADVLPGGSAAISNVLRADALVRVPAGIDHWDAGQSVTARLL